MEVSKVQLANGEVLVDLTNDSVTEETLAEGATAHNASGEQIVGTMKAGGGGSSANAVLYTEQTLTDQQKEQARFNIDAVGFVDFEAAAVYPTMATSAGSLQWNGDLSGRTIVEVEGGLQFVHITDEVPVAMDLTAMCSLWMMGQAVIGAPCEPVPVDSNGSYMLMSVGLDAMPAALVISQDNIDIMGSYFPKKGVYFLNMPVDLYSAVYTNSLRFLCYSYSTPTQGSSGGGTVFAYANVSDTTDIHIYKSENFIQSEQFTKVEIQAVYESKCELVVKIVTGQSTIYLKPIVVEIAASYAVLSITFAGASVNFYSAEYNP